MAIHQPTVSNLGSAAAAIAERLGRSVVEVRPGDGAGTGIIWRPDGAIVTNHHVARRDRAEVVMPDGRRLVGSVTARDPANDLAVIQVPTSGLAAAAIGDARALRPGQIVVAVGHPFGQRAVTIGVVSGVRQHVPGDGMRELVRADVLLGPGSSGGPLADAAGRVVGINAMVAGGLGLAVPSHLAERLVMQGRRPMLGIVAQEALLPPILHDVVRAQRRTAPADDRGDRALLLVSVAPTGLAAQAGLMIGDLVIEADGRPLRSADELLAALAQEREDVLRLGILRGGRPLEVAVRLDLPEPRAA